MPAAERLGVPFVVLAVFLYFLKRIGEWGGTNIIQPMVKVHTEIMDTVKDTNAVNAAANRTNAVSLKEIAIGKAATAKALDKITEMHEAGNKRLDCICGQLSEQNQILNTMVQSLAVREGVKIPEAIPDHTCVAAKEGK